MFSLLADKTRLSCFLNFLPQLLAVIELFVHIGISFLVINILCIYVIWYVVLSQTTIMKLASYNLDAPI